MFDGYKVYKVFHKGMGRYMANLVKHRKLDRRTMSWARYTYILNYGEIPNGMEVDHIDGNKLNDELSNLQLLTGEENVAKRKGQVVRRVFLLKCKCCGKEFERFSSGVKKGGQCCSRECGGKYSHETKRRNSITVNAAFL